MSKKYHDKVERQKHIQIILITMCLIAILLYVYFLTKPKITEYALQDECGPIGGSILHSIRDTDSCANACSAYCLSVKKELHKSDFNIREGPQCNSCLCYCK